MAKQDTSPLLRLPAETRNHIYELVVIDDDTLDLNTPVATHPCPLEDDEDYWSYSNPYNHPCNPCHIHYHNCSLNRRFIQTLVTQPALTRTCRTIRQEALPLFYSENVFVTKGENDGRMELDNGIDGATREWLKAIGARQRSLVGHVYVSFPYCRSLSGYFKDFEESVSISFEKVADHQGKLERGSYLKINFKEPEA